MWLFVELFLLYILKKKNWCFAVNNMSKKKKYLNKIEK